LRIYYVYFHNTSFVPIHVSEIITEMGRRGREVHVFTSIRDGAAKEKISSRSITLHNLWTIRARFISELVFMALLFPYLLLRSLTKRPDFFYTRHSATSLIVTVIAKLVRKPCLTEVNDIVLDKLRFSKISKIKLKWVQLYHYIDLRLADYLLPVTAQIGLWIRHKYLINPRKVVVIPNGVNVHRFSPKPRPEARKRYKIPCHCKVVLSLGSLFPWAGIETLIAAAPDVLKMHPDTLFVIGSGEEPYLCQLKKIVSQSGLGGKFLFFGFIPWDEAAWFISTANVCVAPFIFKEIRTGISSLRVFSYLACGRPVVGSDIPGLGDMIESEGIGISFPMEHHTALARAIVGCLADKEQLQKMGDRARRFVIRKHSWEAIVDKVEATFEAQVGTEKR
jgi:glycosyltransferase involved in cell wall biosynthesis